MDPVTISLIVLCVWFASALFMLGWRLGGLMVLNSDHVIWATIFGPVSFAVIGWCALVDFVVPRWRRLVRYAGRVKAWLGEFPR